MTASLSRTWMPFDYHAFWGSEQVAQMSDAAVLLYLWLLCRQYDSGDLPAPAVLKRLPHRWGSSWDVLWPEIEDCFEIQKDGRLRNPRAHLERVTALERSAKAKAASDAANAAKRAKEPDGQPAGNRTGNRTGNRNGRRTGNRPGSPLHNSTGHTEQTKQTEQDNTTTLPGAAPVVASVAPAPASESTSLHDKAVARGLLHKTVIDIWMTAYQAAIGRKYPFADGKDGKHAKTLCGYCDGDLEDLQERALTLLLSPPEWVAKGGIDLGRFVSEYQKIPTYGMAEGTHTRRAMVKEALRQAKAERNGQQLTLNGHVNGKTLEVRGGR